MIKQIKMMLFIMTLTSSFMLHGCATPGKGTLPQDTGPTMRDVYDQETDSEDTSSDSKASELTMNPYTNVKVQKIVKTQEVVGDAGEYYKPVPNKNMKIYVYPHRTYNQNGEESVVPGYYTYFPMYEHQHYYLPNQRY